MNIVYEDLRIRNAEESDCGQLAAWWNDGSVMAHAGFPNGLNTTVQKIQKQLESESDDTFRRLIIVWKQLPIGEMDYRNLGNRTAEIGIKICRPEYQEKGYGRVILSMLIHELFSQGYEKITLDTNLCNTRAQHVYEKLGFRKVGVREFSWTDQLGNLQSAVDYELTQKDFISFL